MSRSAVCPRCDAVNSVDEDQWGTRVPCDARGSYAAAGFGMKLAVEVDDDLTQQDRNDLFRWGDQSQCVLLLKNGKPVGNWFACQKGNRVFQMILVGAVFDKPWTLRDRLAPVLQRLDQYKK
ncbi:MAG TPA: hypothetical protein VFA26_11450 [Gemmataceae bacterium]|nr:hypothetical protein [Gemmataceae bacterium]